MPTIAIEATITPPQLRRRVARTLTNWLAARGVPAEHVVTRFRTLSDGETFAGAVPLTWALSGQLSGSSEFAFVTCTVSAERDPAFRQELAVEVTRALQPEIPSEAVFIAIHPIDPADHFRGGHPAAPVTDPEEAAP